MTRKNIALCIVATKKYKLLLEQVLKSARKHFLCGHNVHFFVFSDALGYESWLDLDEYTIHWRQIEDLPHPLPCLFRYKYILREARRLKDFDYIFWCDADMTFISDVGDELLGDGITAIDHPCSPNGNMLPRFSEWSSEKNTKSLAYIPPEERRNYWCGGFQGGASEAFLSVAKTLDKNIDTDLGQNIVAVYSDESHFNKYLSKTPPSVNLPHWYCRPEAECGWKESGALDTPEGERSRVLCLDKDLHGGWSFYRGDSKM